MPQAGVQTGLLELGRSPSLSIMGEELRIIMPDCIPPGPIMLAAVCRACCWAWLVRFGECFGKLAPMVNCRIPVHQRATVPPRTFYQLKG